MESVLGRQAASRAVRRWVDAGHVARAVTCALRIYGAEVFGFLSTVIDDDARAREVYTRLARRIRRELPRFPWSCSLRTWLYMQARAELARQRKGKRVETPHPYRGRMDQILRRGLDEADRELLVLRIDRRLTWRELALTSGEADVALAEARLRARFVQVCETLRRTAAEYGA
jgi:hypothetical protein